MSSTSTTLNAPELEAIAMAERGRTNAAENDRLARANAIAYLSRRHEARVEHLAAEHATVAAFAAQQDKQQTRDADARFRRIEDLRTHGR